MIMRVVMIVLKNRLPGSQKYLKQLLRKILNFPTQTKLAVTPTVIQSLLEEDHPLVF